MIIVYKYIYKYICVCVFLPPIENINSIHGLRTALNVNRRFVWNWHEFLLEME